MALLPNAIDTTKTIEAILLDVAILLQRAEAIESLNPNKINNITVSIDTEAKVATISANLPIEVFNTSGAAGEILFVAREYTSHQVISR